MYKTEAYQNDVLQANTTIHENTSYHRMRHVIQGYLSIPNTSYHRMSHVIHISLSLTELVSGIGNNLLLCQRNSRLMTSCHGNGNASKR